MTLTPNERKALRELEFELSAPHTYIEIAAYLGKDERAVRQIETTALGKLRDLAKGWDSERSETGDRADTMGSRGHGLARQR